MMHHAIKSLYAGIFLISAATLLLELTLTRIFDVILWSNLAYFIVSSAIFGFGLGGIFIMLRPMREVETSRILANSAAAFALQVFLLIPGLKLLPLNFQEITAHPIKQVLVFSGLYLLLLAPFFASGLVISVVLTRHAAWVDRLYFWDLFGAGIGCLGIFVLPTLIGAEENLLVVSATGALAAAVFASKEGRMRLIGVATALTLLVSAVLFSNRITFNSLDTKRGLKIGAGPERVEFSRWDPISKIDVLVLEFPWLKQVAYDGGSQSTMLFSFDGEFEKLRQHYFDLDSGLNRYNSGKYVALAHWLKRDSAPVTAIIGSAGGQETLAALTWGAAHVDAVEMVCTVTDLVSGPYAGYIGRIFNDPRVTLTCDEGRSFLRQSQNRYDVIQIHSNHTYSSLANGSGGALPVYLQTVEAYKEYLSHLARDGMLQINYFVHPRMITTAARAWSEIFPGEDFKRHLVVTTGYPTMPTFLIKRSPWTKGEIADIRYYLGPALRDSLNYQVLYAPGEPESANIPPEFFELPLNPDFEVKLPYKVFPATDDQPFFRDLRKERHRLQPDAKGYIPLDTAEFMNASLRQSIPMDDIHLYLLGGLSIILSGIVVLVPLGITRRKGINRKETLPTLIYFSCLGAGFVIIELVLMSKVSLLIGYPVYAMATVLFTLLVSAGIGSYFSARLSRSFGRLAITAIPVSGAAIALFITVFPFLRDLTLGMSQMVRMLLVMAFLIPIGIPLGMPFPLGITELGAKAPSLIPWAWGINGFMTVVGSLLSVLLSMKYGFNLTLLAAVCIYLIAAASFLLLTRTDGERLGIPKAHGRTS